MNPHNNRYNHKVGDVVVLPHHKGIEGVVYALGTAHDPSINVYFVKVDDSGWPWPLREHEVEKKL